MRILVTGSREFTDKALIAEVLDFWGVSPWPIQLAHGTAAGADTLCGQVAEGRGWEVKKFPPDWAKLGKAAGVLRNQQMVEEFKPNIGLGFFKCGVENKGTMDCVRRMLDAGITVHIYTEKADDKNEPDTWDFGV